MSTTLAMALRVEGLDVRMAGQQILKKVSIEVPERGIVTVLGANGVGKTTLMRTISGIYQASAGSIIFVDEAITDLPSHRIVAKGLAQAPEGRQVFSNMSVRENLVLGGGTRAHKDLDRTLEEVLQRFPILRERLAQQAGSLSGGEQQMLCIGRALMSRPRLLLLDEPSMGLAPLMVQKIFETILAVAKEGVTILLVEQNARLALEVSSRGYVMETGLITDRKST